MEHRMESYASCRLTRTERKLAEAAATRSGARFLSDWVRETLLERLREEYGEGALRSDMRVAGNGG